MLSCLRKVELLFSMVLYVVLDAVTACSDEGRLRTNAYICCCTAEAFGGWISCVDGVVSGSVCRAVHGWYVLGELETGVVLVRLLCCVLLPCSLLLNAVAVRWVSALSIIKVALSCTS